MLPMRSSESRQDQVSRLASRQQPGRPRITALTGEKFLAELASLPLLRSHNARANSHPFHGAVSLPMNGASQSNSRPVPVVCSSVRPIPALNNISVTNPIAYMRWFSAGNTRGIGVQEDAAKDAVCDCGFFLRIPAEINVIRSPTGKGSMNVMATLKSGFLYCSLNLFIS